MKLFGYGLLAGFLVVVGGLIMTFTAVPVIVPHSAPAPPITKVVHLDEKLRFIREHPEIKPTILAVGSSITWRQLSGAAFEQLAGGPNRFLNGGTGYLYIHQARALTRFYLDHFREVRTVLVMTSLRDFGNCTSDPPEMFEPKDAARYTFGGWPPVYFQLRYFSPGRYVKGVLTLKERQTPMTGDIYNDRYGSGPIDLPDHVDLGLRYEEIDADPACVDALVGMARDLDERGIRLAVVFTPVHPQYRLRYKDGMNVLSGIAAQLRQHANQIGKNFTFVDFTRDAAFNEGDFYDAFHLDWPAVKRLSVRVATAIKDEPRGPKWEVRFPGRR